MKIKGTIGYDREIDRYVIYDNLGNTMELHCGSCLEICIGNCWIDTSIEMRWCAGKGEWYLTTAGLSIEQIAHDGCTAKIE